MAESTPDDQRDTPQESLSKWKGNAKAKAKSPGADIINEQYQLEPGLYDENNPNELGKAEGDTAWRPKSHGFRGYDSRGASWAGIPPIGRELTSWGGPLSLHPYPASLHSSPRDVGRRFPEPDPNTLKMLGCDNEHIRRTYSPASPSSDPTSSIRPPQSRRTQTLDWTDGVSRRSMKEEGSCYNLRNFMTEELHARYSNITDLHPKETHDISINKNNFYPRHFKDAGGWDRETLYDRSRPVSLNVVGYEYPYGDWNAVPPTIARERAERIATTYSKYCTRWGAGEIFPTELEVGDYATRKILRTPHDLPVIKGAVSEQLLPSAYYCTPTISEHVDEQVGTADMQTKKEAPDEDCHIESHPPSHSL
ncbi:hypothetical protein F5Y09DRAFT_350964 [Xylaria sp. FL1042]|nr:hypothetical protein F5Y09DRAFT_350964 [Xylaria sp. FL1042]